MFGEGSGIWALSLYICCVYFKGYCWVFFVDFRVLEEVRRFFCLFFFWVGVLLVLKLNLDIREDLVFRVFF